MKKFLVWSGIIFSLMFLSNIFSYSNGENYDDPIQIKQWERAR